MGGCERPRPPRTARVLALTLGFSVSPAWAQDGDRKAADALFDEAQSLLDRGKTSEACTKLEQSDRMDPQLGTLLHLSHCYELLGRTGSAYLGFQRAFRLARERNDARADAARQHVDDLQARVPRLVISVEAADLQVLQDGESIEPARRGQPLIVDPGWHVVEARRGGRVVFQRRVTLPEDAVVEMVRVVEESTAVVPASPPTPPSGQTSAPRRGIDQPKGVGDTQRSLGIAVGIAGVVGLGIGGYFGLQTRDTLAKRDDVCPLKTGCTLNEIERNGQLTRDAEGSALAANVGLIAGGAMLLTGVGLYLLSPRAPSEVSISGWLSPHSAGLAGVHRF